MNCGKTGESFVFKESKSKSFKELIKSLTPVCDRSESDDDFDKAFQPLIIDSNMFLGDTWWTHKKWKTSNAGQILYFWFIWFLTWISNGKKHMIFGNIGNLTDHSHQKWVIITIILNK